MRGRPRQADGGNAIVEFGLWLPIVLLALCACLQAMTAIYAERAAQDAARVGLRAQLSGADPVRAAQAALAARADEAVVTAENGSVRVTLPVRQFAPWLPAALQSVSATADGGGGRA
jgi:Flp pilus assembly protein TadG